MAGGVTRAIRRRGHYVSPVRGGHESMPANLTFAVAAAPAKGLLTIKPTR